MDEVRAEIDRVDREIVPLLIERLFYIKQAGHIKVERSSVRDEWRIEDVISKVLLAGEQAEGNPDYLEAVYRYIIEWSIKHEYGVWDSVNDEVAGSGN